MNIFYTVLAVIIAPVWIWLVIKLKLRDIERRNKNDAPIQLNLRR